MAKNFFEVCPSLKLNNALAQRFEPVVVERVGATKKKDLLRVYLFSERLIQKEDILAVQEEIKKQMFANVNMTVRILERYELSAQYNPRKLMEAYHDSILVELREYDHVMFSMFKKAQISYPEEREVHLEAEDTVLNRGKEAQLKEILDKLLQERFGMNAEVTFSYREAVMGKHKAEDDERIRREVLDIVSRATGGVTAADSQEGSEAEGAQSSGSDAEQAQSKAESVKAAGEKAGVTGNGGADKAGKRDGFRKGEFKKGEYKRPLKNSNNPDVIWGRDFEDEIIKLEEIQGEM